MRIALGSDHAGVHLKNELKNAFDKSYSAGTVKHTYVDFGTDSTTSVDYPIFAQQVAEAVASGAFECGILVCGSGVGMSIAANKVTGIRAALVSDVESARLCREHNDANVLALAGRTLASETADKIVQTFLSTAFAGGRHQRRIDKITAIEKKRTETSDE